MGTTFTGSDEKLTVAQHALEAGVATLIDRDSWKKYLEFQTRFHKYSPTNTMLILIQNPAATRVAGYTTWKNMGRQVMLGQKGIFIWAPSARPAFVEKTEDENRASGSPDRRLHPGPKPTSFHITHVFDVSQTEGKDIPAWQWDTAPAAAEQLYPLTKDLAHDLNLAIVERKMRTKRLHGGLRDDGNGTPYIELNTHFDEADRACTILHEIGHHLLGHLADKGERQDIELEAESVAYMVLHALGIEANFAFEYIASWVQENQAIKGKLAIRVSRIAKAAKVMLEAITKIQHTQTTPALQLAA